MPRAHRFGDIGTGHSCYPPRNNNGGSSTVFVNNKGWHRVTDGWPSHCCPGPVCHPGNLAEGSPDVYADNLAVGRVGDPVTCGSKAFGASPNVYANGTGSPGGGQIT